ncbi:MAG: hypothetical protein KatS3mg082_2774 [Nitrospiraceae bacterium]|nr:MAG: hypothetical protein KatS3mg082_2774 [Nitrospiraceae bacterium]
MAKSAPGHIGPAVRKPQTDFTMGKAARIPGIGYKKDTALEKRIIVAALPLDHYVSTKENHPFRVHDGADGDRLVLSRLNW